MAKAAKKNLQTPPETEDSQPSLDIEPQESPAAEDPTLSTPPIEALEPAEAEESEPVIEPAPEKRRPGRPSKTDPPVLRSSIINRINNLESWEGTRVYVYRWEPFHDRKVGGKQSVSVKRYEGPFDEQDMLEDPGLGSGVYELVVNRTDPATRMRKVIDSGVVKLLNMKYPPRIPKGEWVDDERNKDWEWARNMCDKTEAPGAVPIVPTVDPLVEILRDTIKNQNTQLLELQKEMRQTAAKEDPSMKGILAILAPFIPAIVQKLTAAPLPPPPPPPPPPESPLEKLAMAMLTKQLETKGDPAAELERTLDLQDKIEARVGGRNGGRSRKTGWQEVISECTPPVAEALKPVFQIIAMGMAQAAQKGQQQAQQQQPGPQQQPQQPTPPAIQQAPPMHEPPKPGPQLVEQKPTLEAIAAAVLQHLQQEKTGYQLGDWYIEEFGEQEFKEIRVQGKPQLLLALKDTAEWRDIFKFSESGALDEMLTEFFTWEPPDDDEDDGEDEAPAANLDAINTGWTQPEGVPAQ